MERPVKFLLEAQMKGRLLVLVGLAVGLAATGCGGGGGKVSFASLRPRLLPASAVPGFGLQRTLDWSDPVNLVGEGVFLPQATHPSTAVKEFQGAHLEGAAGEVLTNGAGLDATDVRLGVARFKSASGATQVRDWMHKQDLEQPCFTQCVYTTHPTTVPGVPSVLLVVQSTHVPQPHINVKKIPPGVAPPQARGGPANYLAEFTVGSYLYWAVLQADASAKAKFEQGVRLFYTHASKVA
jgi:hypothetical protein